MNLTMENPTRPRAAACPNSTDLRATSAQDIYLSCGHDAVAGWPLPNGWLPVAVPQIGVTQTTPAEWERYMALCEGERVMRCVNP